MLVAGGTNNSGTLSSAELYDVGLGFSNSWQPKIHSLKLTNGKLLLTGSLFQGISQASGGNTQDSSSNYPIVQLRSIDNSAVTFLPVDPVEGWSDTSSSSLRVKHFPRGPPLVTVFTNGIPSSAEIMTSLFPYQTRNMHFGVSGGNIVQLNLGTRCKRSFWGSRLLRPYVVVQLFRDDLMRELSGRWL